MQDNLIAFKWNAFDIYKNVIVYSILFKNCRRLMYKNIQQHAVESTNIQFLAALSFVHHLVVASNYCYCTINSILQQKIHISLILKDGNWGNFTTRKKRPVWRRTRQRKEDRKFDFRPLSAACLCLCSSSWSVCAYWRRPPGAWSASRQQCCSTHLPRRLPPTRAARSGSGCWAGGSYS